ncbi:uncharacterized protein [Miscanthus floridulus]|uniref:uncharacterized protein n=1 Tax=Miscanthus floridulus TaxID=154761 RepID=UPI00345A8B8B
MKESSYRSPLMTTYCQEVRKLEDKFQGIELHHVPRRDNAAADFLAKLAARRDPSPSGVFINDVHEPSARVLEDPTQTQSNSQPAVKGSDPDTQSTLGGSNPNADPAVRGFDPSTSITTSSMDVAIVALDQTDWRIPLLAYLLEEVLPPERTKVQRIARRAKTFIVLGDELYKRSPLGVLMKCIPASQGKQILLKVHARICRHHAAPRSLVRKTFR